jgi:hypothetical protein
MDGLISFETFTAVETCVFRLYSSGVITHKITISNLWDAETHKGKPKKIIGATAEAFILY